MRDLGVLKERIEYAERHLKAAHTARERESDALLKMWNQIRGRFDAQEQEIARFREEVAELTRTNDELSSLVDRLVSIVEGSVGDSANETVPEVTRLADGLLRSEPETALPGGSAPALSFSDLDSMETDDPLELGTPLDELMGDDDDEGETSFGDILNRAMSARAGDATGDRDEDDSDDDDFGSGLDIPERVETDSASVGIRDLIARIEGSVRPADDDEDDDTGDDQLAQELQEIEALRDQLSGLHRKVAEND